MYNSKPAITNNSVEWDMNEESNITNQFTNKSLGGHGMAQRSEKKKPSLAYIRHEDGQRQAQRFEHRRFNETYKASKARMNENKEEFFQQIVRRRSFYSKKRN